MLAVSLDFSSNKAINVAICYIANNRNISKRIMVSSALDKDGYFSASGLHTTAPEGLNRALKEVLDSMATTLYPTSSDELTESEQAVLRQGGVNLTPSTTRDLMAETAIKYAALIESGFSTKEVATRLDITESQVRQMISRKTLYSILLNNRRYVPIFQFEDSGPMTQGQWCQTSPRSMQHFQVTCIRSRCINGTQRPISNCF